jgi:glucose/arabinose dehydrogenase
VAQGRDNGPWNGVVFHAGAFYVAEGGQLRGGRILRIVADGAVTALVSDLPSRGDHHANGPAVGPDGRLYFSVGTHTNSGVVGEENAEFGWLERYPTLHDVPCRDLRLVGVNYDTRNVLEPGSSRVETGAFVPFGTPTAPGQRIPGRIPCNGAVFSIAPQGGELELVAWGFRNPFGIAVAPDGGLYVTDNSYDDRGSRPVHGTGDLLWRVERGPWYGWPDFHGQRRLDDGDHYVSLRGPRPQMLLQEHPQAPPRPAAVLGVHAAAGSPDFSRGGSFGFPGDAFVPLFGDQAPTTGKTSAPVGFKVVRVDPRTGVVHDFAVNRGAHNAPASRLGARGLERPIAARFDPAGDALYVVDFGVLTMSERGASPRQGTGVVWRIARTGPAGGAP